MMSALPWLADIADLEYQPPDGWPQSCSRCRWSTGSATTDIAGHRRPRRLKTMTRMVVTTSTEPIR